jgi:hypothetical protein
VWARRRLDDDRGGRCGGGSTTPVEGAVFEASADVVEAGEAAVNLARARGRGRCRRGAGAAVQGEGADDHVVRAVVLVPVGCGDGGGGAQRKEEMAVAEGRDVVEVEEAGGCS